MNKVHFLTFANSGYSFPNRIISQAKESNFFTNIQCYSEAEIRPLILKHPIHFLFRRKQGFGRFIWKPYIILKYLLHLDAGDFLVYSDSGTHINPAGRVIFRSYLERMRETDKSVGVFEVSEAYKASSFVRKNAVDEYLPNFYEDPNSVLTSVYAGLIIAQKTSRAHSFFQDWFHLCEAHLPKIDLGRKTNEIPSFVGQDADSGFLPLVLSKHQDHVIFPGSHVNLYNEEGIQLSHALSKEEYQELSWGPIAKYPFNLRRDR